MSLQFLHILHIICNLWISPASSLSFKQYFEENKAIVALENPNWNNGIILKPTLAPMAASALN